MTGSQLPVKLRRKFDPTRTIRSLLRQLGLPKSVWGPRNFWEHHYGRFDIVLYDAKQLYKAHARVVHPRRDTDAEEQATQLNVLWDEIQRRIKQRMEPTLWLSGKRPVERAPAPRHPGEYVRMCQYVNCGRIFITDHPRKIYCHFLHKQYQATLKYERKRRAYAKRIYRHCALKGCGRPFWTLNKHKIFHSNRCARIHHMRLHYRRKAPQYLARAKLWRQQNRERTLAYYRRPDIKAKRYARYAKYYRERYGPKLAEKTRLRRESMPWFYRTCALKTCGVEFKTKKVDQKYHSLSCTRRAVEARRRARKKQLKLESKALATLLK